MPRNNENKFSVIFLRSKAKESKIYAKNKKVNKYVINNKIYVVNVALYNEPSSEKNIQQTMKVAILIIARAQALHKN